MSNDEEVFYYQEDKSTAVADVCINKKSTKGGGETGNENRERSSLPDKKSKELASTQDKKSREEARLVESGADNERTKKGHEIHTKKHSKHHTGDETGCKISGNVDASNFSLVKIQIETCPQPNLKNLTPNVCSIESTDEEANFRGTRFKHNQSHHNSAEAERDSEPKKGGSKNCAKKSGAQNCSKNNKTNTENSKDKKPKGSSKNCSTQGSKSCEKSMNTEKRETLEMPNTVKKPSCSPFKKLSRSSLTIEPDKITVNLSKYSPCASRLAASSKILSSTSPTSPESPLRAVRSRSPSNFINDRLSSRERSRERATEKSTIQASLSLNIRQFQKSNSTTPRSKSVGDSCVASPTSEETTTSCSPTGTEILSLDEVGANNVQSIDKTVESPTIIGKNVSSERLASALARCAQKTRKTTLETKC